MGSFYGGYWIQPNLEEIEEIREDFQDGEDEDACGDCQHTGVHVVVGGQLLLFDPEEPVKELMSLVDLIC